MTSFRHHSVIVAAVGQEEQSAYIKIQVLRGNTRKEFHENFLEACGGSAVSSNTVHRFVRHFAKGNFDVSDDPRCRPQIKATDKLHVEKVKDL